MSTPLTLSVVIPTYNRATFLARAIDSARSQMRKDDELIVVDDGSTDETRDVLGRYGAELTVIPGERGGAGAARNRGVRVARGDLVAFLDSDDEWFPHKTTLQRRLFEARPDVLYSFGEMACSFRDGSTARRQLWTWHRDPRPWIDILPGSPFSSIAVLPSDAPNFNVHIGDLFPDMAHRLYVLTSSYMVRRLEAGQSLRFQEDVPIYEDWACFGRVARLGLGAFMDLELAWQHGQSTERLSDANDLDRCRVHAALLDEIWLTNRDYMDAHGAEYSRLLESVNRRLARNQIAEGQTSEARATLARMREPPNTYQLLATLPPSVLNGVLAARRYVKRHLSGGND